MTKIGILGFGQVGAALAKGFIGEGHEVQVGGRSAAGAAEKVKKSGLEKVKADTNQNVAAWGEVIVIATPAAGAVETAKSVAGAIEGKVVIDVGNPISGGPENGILPYFTDRNDSLLEMLQRAVPKARFVKAFSCIGSGGMYKPQHKGSPTHYIAGNDEDAKKVVVGILKSFGWKSIADLGSATGARAIEPLCQLW
eukprot:TRINITY_DN32786_c0_g1_i1.p2 TRINITY_DN32786_c0_g1~~TRINITY_DN32786_c0_g1_i1.p2  ORF type:complete len:196 (-),score=56.94 TRINITY_DN32786_c0_g1_i1:102-689(-)